MTPSCVIIDRCVFLCVVRLSVGRSRGQYTVSVLALVLCASRAASPESSSAAGTGHQRADIADDRGAQLADVADPNNLSQHSIVYRKVNHRVAELPPLIPRLTPPFRIFFFFLFFPPSDGTTNGTHASRGRRHPRAFVHQTREKGALGVHR